MRIHILLVHGSLHNVELDVYIKLEDKHHVQA